MYIIRKYLTISDLGRQFKVIICGTYENCPYDNCGKKTWTHWQNSVEKIFWIFFSNRLSDKSGEKAW